MNTKDDLYIRGEEIRREVLGDDYVQHSAATTDALGAPLREFAIKNLWGDVWNRPGLSRRDRSIINLAILAATNQQAELALHLRGALNNGVKREEIAEIFLQLALYCGVPAGSNAIRIARQFLAEYDTQQAALT